MDYIATEQQLFNEILKLQQGNQESFEKVYTLSVKYIYQLAYELVSAANGKSNEPGESVGDIVNKIINLVYDEINNNISSLQNPEDFYYWAGNIVTTDTVNYLKSTGKFVIDGQKTEDETVNVQEYYAQDSEAFVSENILVDETKQEILKRYLSGLSPFAKAVIQYYYYECLQVSYISYVLGCSTGTVKKQIAEIKENIRNITSEGDSENVLLYDMTALPIVWLMFQSSFRGVSLKQLLAQPESVSGAAGATGTGGAAGTGGTAGTTPAGKPAAASMQSGGTQNFGNQAVAGKTENAVKTAGGKMTSTVSSGGKKSVGRKVGIPLGAKVGIGVAALLVVGGAAAAIYHISGSKNKLSKTEEQTETQEITEGTENTTENTGETSESTSEAASEATTGAATTEAESVADRSMEEYAKFLSGEATAVVDNGYENDVYTSTNGETFSQGETVDIHALENNIYTEKVDAATEITGKKYAYVDAGNDGVQELVINVSGDIDGYGEGYGMTAVVKYMDDGLHVTYVGNSYPSYGPGTWTEVTDGGRVNCTLRAQFSAYYTEMGILDANGIYHNVYALTSEMNPVMESAGEAFEAANATMVSEYGDECYPAVTINEYIVGGVTYYVLHDEDTSIPENARYHELINGIESITVVSEDDIASIIDQEQQKYVQGVSSGDDLTYLDWTEY